MSEGRFGGPSSTRTEDKMALYSEGRQKAVRGIAHELQEHTGLDRGLGPGEVDHWRRDTPYEYRRPLWGRNGGS